MNSVMHPTGPEDPNTYWIRRGILIGAVLVSLALIWWVLSGLFGGTDEGTVAATPQNPGSLISAGGATVTPSATPSASATPAPSASQSASASSTPTPSATPTPTPSQPTTCASDGLALDITGDQAPKVGSTVAFKVSVTNGGATACKLDLGKAPVQVAVTSGSDRIWTTVHCSKWAPAGEVVELAPGKAFSTSVSWPTKRSADGCQLRTEKLLPGTYRATVSADGAQPDTLVMNLK